MRRTVFAFILATLALVPLSRLAQAAEPSAAPAIPTAIVDIDYVDTSGESADETQAHRKFLDQFAAALQRDLSATGKFRFIKLMCGQAPCTAKTDPYEVQKAAKAAGAKLVIVAGFHKMSTLVQWMKVQIVDEDKGQIVFDRLQTFRGDTEDAWQHAEIFLLREIMAAPIVVAAEPAPVKLAVFDFELEDFSGGASVVSDDPHDIEDLKNCTEKAKSLLTQSGRYTLVDASSADTPEIKAHSLRNCNGCEAAIAKKLGADQALLGIVTRISRTDYAVTFKLRDARTGAAIDVEQTDLRIGANYSWDRGTAWLIQRKLLDRPAPHS